MDSTFYISDIKLLPYIYENNNSLHLLKQNNTHQLNTTTDLIHQRFEVGVVRENNGPVTVTGEGPASDGANQSLLVLKAVNQVRDELREMLGHAIHATFRNGSQGKDP